MQLEQSLFSSLIHFGPFLSRLTHLFLAHTPPGLHHHLDTLPMPLKYRPSFEAEGGGRKRVTLLTEHGNCGKTAWGGVLTIENSNYAQMQLKAADIIDSKGGGINKEQVAGGNKTLLYKTQ